MALWGALAALGACDRKPPEAPAPIRLPPELTAKDYPPTGWTWAEVPGGAGRRYGVGSPSKAMRAQVLVVPGRAPAEAWYAAANRLVERNYAVWVLDPLPGPLPPEAARTMAETVIRPGGNRRLVVLGEGEGARAALAAGLKADLLFLWAPRLAVPGEDLGGWPAKLGFGRLVPPGAKEWAEGEPKDDKVAAAWMAANAPLRPRPASYDERALARRIAQAAAAAAPAGPVRLAGGDAAAKAACGRWRDCKPIAPGPDALADALDALTADDAPTAPPVRRARGT